MIAFKFLARGGVAPFTRFRWPDPGTWVDAPGDGPGVWVHACRARDLPHWLEEELWRVELADPVRHDRYQVAAPRARLVARIEAWTPDLGRAYAHACALRARDLALPHVAPPLRTALAAAVGPEAIAGAVAAGDDRSAVADYLADAARTALVAGPATAAYVAAVLASSLGDGLAAFEAERAWQAGWLAGRLGL